MKHVQVNHTVIPGYIMPNLRTCVIRDPLKPQGQLLSLTYRLNLIPAESNATATRSPTHQQDPTSSAQL